MRHEEPGGRQSRYAKEREEDSTYTLAHAPVLFLQAEGPACAASSVTPRSPNPRLAIRTSAFSLRPGCLCCTA
jgi:hypothetical protein